MVEAGITPEDTLLAATRYAAELLKWEDKVGTIEVGKMADIVAVDGNPLANMSVMTRDNIKLVVKDGTVYKNELK